MLANKLLKPNRNYVKKGDLRFASKKYSNPFFKGRKKTRTKNINFEISLKIKLASFALLSLLIFLCGMALYSNFFKVSNINVSGEGRISSDKIKEIIEKEISSKYLKFLPENNIILLSTNNLKKELENKYAFEKLEIRKDYPRSIVVEYKEKSYAFVLKEDDNYFYLDVDGSIIDEANILEVSNQLYPIIENQSEAKITDNKTSIDRNEVDFVLEAFTKFKDRGGEVSISHFVVDNDAKTVKAHLENGPVVFFNSERGVEGQIEKLFIVKKEKIKTDFEKKEYIDLRYGDSVYYR